MAVKRQAKADHSARGKAPSAKAFARGAQRQAKSDRFPSPQSDLIAADAFAPSAKARALLAGVKRAEADLRLGGGAFTLGEVLTLLRISRQAVHNKVQDGSLFVVKGPGGRLLFPTFQFTENGPVQDLKQLIAAFPSKNRWMLLNFLVHPDPLLNGRAPIDVLKRGDVDLVVLAARSIGEQGGGASAASNLKRLYARAFAEFGAAALWNKKQLADPAPGDALSIARALRIEGDLKARRLAEEIEALCHAAH